MSYLIPSYGKHLIPVGLAKEMIAKYTSSKSKILSPEYQNLDILALNETFNADDIRLLLLQPNCVGFRIHYGMDESLKIHAILVGVDQNGNDITIKNPNLQFKEDGEYVLEESTRCPPTCPPTSL
jgi:hypothetical protein